jgi:hypothetical protein
MFLLDDGNRREASICWNRGGCHGIARELVYRNQGYGIGIDRTTGKEVWTSPLKGADFVNVVLDKGQLFAATKGELYCLDPATGHIRWKNELKGMGWGLIAIAPSADGNWSVIEEKHRQDQADAAASTTTATT